MVLTNTWVRLDLSRTTRPSQEITLNVINKEYLIYCIQENDKRKEKQGADKHSEHPRLLHAHLFFTFTYLLTLVHSRRSISGCLVSWLVLSDFTMTGSNSVARSSNSERRLRQQSLDVQCRSLFLIKERPPSPSCVVRLLCSTSHGRYFGIFSLVAFLSAIYLVNCVVGNGK